MDQQDQSVGLGCQRPQLQVAFDYYLQLNVNFPRGRHLMDDLFRMMPHAKSDSKMQKKESLFAVNEIAEMKNCSRVLLVEGRRKRDVFLWAGIVARGPSVKFEVGKQMRRMLLGLKHCLSGGEYSHHGRAEDDRQLPGCITVR